MDTYSTLVGYEGHLSFAALQVRHPATMRLYIKLHKFGSILHSDL